MTTKPTVLDAVKIQARVVVPIVKALERELGAERAHAIVGQAIAGSYAEWQSRRAEALNTHPREGNVSHGFPVETEVVEDTDSSFGVNMVRCHFAEYFRSIGEPAIGGLLTCGVDFAAQAALRPDWEFRRSGTLMSGAPHCDFRWRLRSAGRVALANPEGTAQQNAAAAQLSIDPSDRSPRDYTGCIAMTETTRYFAAG